MRTSLAIAAVAALLLTGCTAAEESAADSNPAAPASTSATGPVETLLATHGLEGLDGKELVDTLDETALSDRPEGLMASVRYDEVLISAADWPEPQPVELDGDEFYLSFAPFVDTTHECYFHSLTTCVGELGNEEFQVTVTDSATGEVLVDEAMTTFDNGFVGVWLPRDIDATLRIEGAAGSAETAIGTGPEDPTCLTTVQLA
ncbi:CueP family metal-binding protein [Demequina sp. SO4-18]|uniref:CueP family metal-binding protein n=1 Tax=Demequina sp. SO4-18 TaxID=3401026 RepID=UPI003B5C2EBF